MRKTARVVMMLCLGTAVWDGCSHFPGVFRGVVSSVSTRPEGTACAWLPGESEQWRLRRDTVRDKVQNLVVPALQAAELDAWLLVEREWQRDPMLDSLAIREPGDKVVLLVDGGGAQLRAFGFAVSPTVLAQLAASGLFDQVEPLAPHAVTAVLDRFRPQSIGINYSGRVPLADGMTTGSRQFAAWLVGRRYAATFRSAEAVAITFRGTRTSQEIELARQAARCAVEIAERALSEKVIAPGQTTIGDLTQRVADGVRDAHLEAQSAPRVSVIPSGERAALVSGLVSPDRTIQQGDLIQVALSLRYAGVAANASRIAYVLRLWESEPPADIRRAFDIAEQARGAVAVLFRVGRTGSQIAAEIAAWAKQHEIVLELAAQPVGDTARDVGTSVSLAAVPGPYDPAGLLAERPLQVGDIQSLAFDVTAALDDGQLLTLPSADDAVVGFGGLDFLVPPGGLLTVPGS